MVREKILLGIDLKEVGLTIDQRMNLKLKELCQRIKLMMNHPYENQYTAIQLKT